MLQRPVGGRWGIPAPRDGRLPERFLALRAVIPRQRFSSVHSHHRLPLNSAPRNDLSLLHQSPIALAAKMDESEGRGQCACLREGIDGQLEQAPIIKGHQRLPEIFHAIAKLSLAQLPRHLR
jgi:hypothetical protein